jgi:YD repeat-containing protein
VRRPDADLNLAAGTAHTYTVSAFDGDANTSDPSTAATATALAPPPPSVTCTYDLADRLTAITTASGSATTFTIDALGRHASRTTGTATPESYSYLGSSNTVVGITSGSTTTVSAIDAVGNRVATAAGGAWGYLLADPVDSEFWCTHTALGVHYRCTSRQGPTRAPVGTLRHGGRNAADRPLLHQP